MIVLHKLIQSKSDYIGSLASALCMVHCLVTPILFVVQAGKVHCSSIAPIWWSMIDYIFLIISAFAVFQSARNTSNRLIPWALFSFWIFLASGILFQVFIHSTFLLVIKWTGAIGLAIFHVINLKYCRCAGDSCCHTMI